MPIEKRSDRPTFARPGPGREQGENTGGNSNAGNRAAKPPARVTPIPASEGGEPKDKRKFLPLSVVGVLLFILGFGVLAGIATPKFRASGERANTRACFANQKTIAGALEMYCLDKKLESKDFKALGPVGPELVSGGYLQSLPDDPGAGEGSFENYHLVPRGNGVSCRVHGPIQR